MKKIKILFLFVLLLFSCSSSPNKKLFLGSELININYVQTLKEQDKSVNDTYLMKDGYIAFLYSFIANDVKENNTSIIKDIKNASKIYINIGNKDIERCIKYEQNEYVFDESLVQNQMELFSYYYYHILEEIREVYQRKIYLLSPYNVYMNDAKQNIYEKIMNEFYSVYEEVASYFSCDLIDIRNVSLLEKDKAFAYVDRLIRYEN